MLPKEQPITATRKTVPLSIIAAVIMFFALNMMTRAFLDSHGTNLGYITVSHKWNVLKKIETPVDWLFLGDSALSQGIDPNLLNATNDIHAVNLGTIGAFGLSDDLWMLEEYIDRFGAPKKVIIVHVYDVWHRNIQKTLLGRIPRDSIITKSLLDSKISVEDRFDIVINRYLPLLAERTSLRTALRYEFLKRVLTTEELDKIRVQDHEIPRNTPILHDSGYVEICGNDPTLVRKDLDGHKKTLKKQNFKLSADNRLALKRIAELSDIHGFALYLVPAPVYDRLNQDPNFIRYREELNNALEAVASDHRLMTVITDLPTFSAPELQNVDHLNCSAVSQYTSWVANRVQGAPLQQPLAP